MNLAKIVINSHTGFQPLLTCIVGRSYPPEFYDKILNKNVRQVMQKVAEETEEDYQKLIKILENFKVEVFRPNIETDNNFEEYLLIEQNGTRRYQIPPMNPRDNLLAVGENLFVDRPYGEEYIDFYDNIIKNINSSNVFHSKNYDCLKNLSGPSITRLGNRLYFDRNMNEKKIIETFFKDYECKILETGGHSDAVYCPISPGLIASIKYENYNDTFPGWEVVYLKGESWEKIKNWEYLKQKNNGNWWIPGEEKNNDLVDYVNHWYNHWVGYVEETVFDVNMLVLDEQNVICNQYNDKIFDALSRHKITGHICNFRHRYFWDGGLHCITLDLNRKGVKQNYF